MYATLCLKLVCYMAARTMLSIYLANAYQPVSYWLQATEKEERKILSSEQVVTVLTMLTYYYTTLQQ